MKKPEFQKMLVISDEDLATLSKQFTPLVRAPKTKQLHHVPSCDPRKEAFNMSESLGEMASTVVELFRIQTVHDCGHPAMFKPSVAEVMAQLLSQRHQLEKTAPGMVVVANAFETKQIGFVDIENERGEPVDVAHIAETVFYREKRAP